MELRSSWWQSETSFGLCRTSVNVSEAFVVFRRDTTVASCYVKTMEQKPLASGKSKSCCHILWLSTAEQWTVEADFTPRTVDVESSCHT